LGAGDREARARRRSVGEVSDLTGVTIRTLHRGDEVGLLSAPRDRSGYRSCGAAELSDLHGAWVSRYWRQGAYTPETHVDMARMYAADAHCRAYYDDRVGPWRDPSPPREVVSRAGVRGSV